MKLFLLDSLATQIAAVLLIGLTASHVLSVALYFTDRANALEGSGVEHIGERVATVIQLLENAPDEDHSRLLGFVSEHGLTITKSDENKFADSQDDNWRTDLLLRSLNTHFQNIGEREIHVSFIDDHKKNRPEEQEDSKIVSSNTALISVQLSDGRWLNFSSSIGETEPFWSHHFIISIVVIVSAVLLLSVLIVHFVMSPLWTFSKAAEQLGLDIQSPPLPIRGPREVRHAAVTFNEMQQRILKLLDDRTRMLAAISHDLRTPITRLRLRADVIDQDGSREKAIQDLDEMESMISSLLTFAHNDTDDEQLETVDLAALIESICRDFADLGYAATFSAETSDYELYCRRLSLRRAFTNLIENAVRYGGNAEVTLATGENDYIIRIDDEGPGIPESEHEKVLRPFYRVEQSRNRNTGGSGIGLHVANTVIRNHRGKIIFKNREEGGLRVEVLLPVQLKPGTFFRCKTA